MLSIRVQNAGIIIKSILQLRKPRAGDTKIKNYPVSHLGGAGIRIPIQV